MIRKSLLILLSTSVLAGNLPHKYYLPQALAEKMAYAAFSKAEELGIKISVAIVDDTGELSYFSKMDQARSVSTEVSVKKGETAARIQVPTRKMMENNKK